MEHSQPRYMISNFTAAFYGVPNMGKIANEQVLVDSAVCFNN